MESPDLGVLADALQWHDAGQRVSLITVVQTWGSAPRPPGALLAIREDGMVSGSVSGGCVEDDLIARTQAAFKGEVSNGDTGLPRLIVYGSLTLVQEPLLDPSWLAPLLKRSAEHGLVARTLTLATGEVRLSDAVRDQTLQFDGATLPTVFGPTWRLLLIGAGQLSRCVAQIATMLDFEVLVCDPREEYASDLNPGTAAIRRVQGMPDDAVRALAPDAHTAVVALTHDPKLDDMALLEALQSGAFYVGALGANRNQAARKQRLSQHFGLTAGELARLHGPVGLALGARTPAEIAVAIVAEMIQMKNAGAVAVA